jgi:hypothetical protein
MSNYNQIVGETWFSVDGNKIETIVTVSNTYPIFLKIQQDAENGIYLYENLKGTTFIGKDGFIRINYEKANTSLIEFIKGIYPSYKDIGLKSFETVYKSKDYSIDTVLYCDYKLIFLRTSMYLILLNYVPKDFILTEQTIKLYFIPTGISNEDVHIQSITYQGYPYRVINTFNAFVPYAVACGKIASLEFNYRFFKDFKEALYGKYNIDTNKAFQEITINPLVKISFLDPGFRFYFIEDIIIICDYLDKMEIPIELKPIL